VIDDFSAETIRRPRVADAFEASSSHPQAHSREGLSVLVIQREGDQDG
jgi:hypothetical protein